MSFEKSYEVLRRSHEESIRAVSTSERGIKSLKRVGNSLSKS